MARGRAFARRSLEDKSHETGLDRRARTQRGLLPATALAQPAASITQSIAGTRLDVNATGEVTRVPDVAIITAGVVIRARLPAPRSRKRPTRMERVRAALKRAGIADRDIQTSNSASIRISLREQPAAQLNGYSATNQLASAFATSPIREDPRRAGREGANQINGPNLTIDKPEAALDEARAKAVVAGRAARDLYARSLGMRVVRVVSVSESGGYACRRRCRCDEAARRRQLDTKIDPGEQKLQVNLAMVFELQ
jgi:uncharacterized protein YggE